MSDLSDKVVDYFPANGNTGVPLSSNITLTLQGTDYDEDSLTGFYVEGPDTDQYIGPGMAELVKPDNISQGDLDDFLQSPGYKGIVAGTTTVSGIGGNTVITFAPTNPFYPLTDYTGFLTSVYEADGTTEISGYIKFSWTTGSGSIEELPTTSSTSVLTILTTASAEVASGDTTNIDFVVEKTTPADHAIEQSTRLSEIEIEFNKAIDATQLTVEHVTVETVKAIEHPNLTVTKVGTLAKTLEVDSKKLKIKI